MKKKVVIVAVFCAFFINNFSDAKMIYSNVLKSDKESANVYDYVAKGNALCEQFKLDSAQKYFEKAIKSNPQDASAHNGLGLTYYLKTTSSDMSIIQKHGELLTLAQKQFEAAIKCDAKNSQAYNNLGKIYQERGNLAKAQQNYQKALALTPKYSDAMGNLASVDFLKNKIPDSVIKYKKALAYDSNNLKAYVGLAEVYCAQSRYSEALSEANTALSLFPNSAKAQAIFGKIYDEQGNKVAALNSYRKAITIKPENLEPYLAIAEIYQERGDNDFAIAELKNVVSLNPNYKEGYLKLADMSLLENKPEVAINYYQKVVGDPVFSAYALKGLAKAYFYNAKNSSATAQISTSAEYIDAQNALLKAIDADPQDLQLYLALMRVSKLLADDNLSQLYLNKIISKSDFSPISCLLKGEAELVCNNYKNAYQDFTDAIASVENLQDCVYIGDIFVENRQYDMAQAAFYKALGYDAQSKKAKLGLSLIAKNKAAAQSHYNLAKSFYAHGEKVSAIEELKQAVAFEPKNKASQLLLAKSYSKIGDNKNALAHYQMYLNLLDDKDRQYKKFNRKVKHLTKKVSKSKPVTVQDL